MIKKFPTKIFFVGIGGSGVSGLARILKNLGHLVAGSDAGDSKAVRQLVNEGIQCKIGHFKSNLAAGYDLVIYSPAVPAANAERKEASRLGIRQLSYPEALGVLTRGFYTVTVCGTHGKTTTTALLACALINCSKDPTVLVGSTLQELNGYNSRVGEGEYFLLEACEYRRAFLNYQPQAVIATNIEADHLDYFRNLKDYCSAFADFFAKVPANGIIVANYDDQRLMKLMPPRQKILTYGTGKGADYLIAENKIFRHGKLLAELDLKIPGSHNLSNAAAVIALADQLKLNIKLVTKSLNSYQGSQRRFEIKGKIGKTLIIDDYAHHPTEIRATLQSVKEKYGKKSKVLCIFQPHQYSRTFSLLKEFSTAFGAADMVIIPNIFRARDSSSDLKRINAPMLVRKIAENHSCVTWGRGLQKTASLVRKIAGQFDVIITMGAGDITRLSDLLAG